MEIIYLHHITRPCFDWQSPHWESWSITVQDGDKTITKDQFLGSACCSPNCGFYSCEIFRKRINRGRYESTTTYYSSSQALFSSWTKLNTRLYNHPPRLSCFMPLSLLSCPLIKPFCYLVFQTVPPPKDQLQYQLSQISSRQLGGLPPSAEHSESSFLLSFFTLFIVSHQGSLKDFMWRAEGGRRGGKEKEVKANPGRLGKHHGNGICQSGQLVCLCFLILGFLPKLLFI